MRAGLGQGASRDRSSNLRVRRLGFQSFSTSHYWGDLRLVLLSLKFLIFGADDLISLSRAV